MVGHGKWFRLGASVAVSLWICWHLTTFGWNKPRVITYPVDVLLATSAPIYQNEFVLDDVVFSSKFESGNLRSAV